MHIINWLWRLAAEQPLATATFAVFFLVGVSTVLYQHGSALRNALVGTCKYLAGKVCHAVCLVFSWMKQMLWRFYWLICTYARRKALDIQRASLGLGITGLILEAQRQKANATVVENDEVRKDELASKGIAAAMEARIEGLRDAGAIVFERRVPDLEESITEWRYASTETNAYWKLERMDKKWNLGRKIYFPKELPDRKEIVKHLTDRYSKFSLINYRTVLQANGKTYGSPSDIVGDADGDMFQVIAIQRFIYHHYGRAFACSAMLGFLGEATPKKLWSHVDDKVKCRIYRNNKNQVIALTDETIRRMHPTLENIEDLDMQQHGLEEYISGSLTEGDYHW